MPVGFRPPLPLTAYVAVAVAYFVLGVAVGVFVRERRTPAVVVLIAPGVVAGLGFLVWVVSTLA